MATPVSIAGHAYLFGTAAERATAGPAFDLRFVETDGTRLVYIGTGAAWLGPYTAADVGLGGGGGSSGGSLPLGVGVSQANVTASTTPATMTFSQPAKAVKITVVNRNLNAATEPFNAYFLVCFDPPSTVIRDDWLNETLVGPRSPVIVDQVFERTFESPSGVQVTTASMGFKANVTDADIDMKVEIIT